MLYFVSNTREDQKWKEFPNHHQQFNLVCSTVSTTYPCLQGSEAVVTSTSSGILVLYLIYGIYLPCNQNILAESKTFLLPEHAVVSFNSIHSKWFVFTSTAKYFHFSASKLCGGLLSGTENRLKQFQILHFFQSRGANVGIRWHERDTQKNLAGLGKLVPHSMFS